MALTKVANTLLDFTGGFVAGNVSFPAITTVGDTNTGIFFPAADTIAFSEGGAEAARFDSAGNFLVGTATPSASYGRITVSGSGISITPDTAAKFQIGRYSAGAPYSYIKMGSTSSGLKFTDPADSVDLMTLSSTGALALYGASASANGVGITFPAAQSASSDANTLDDYEEGTFTPTIANFSVSGTTTLTGAYTKIGRMVFVSIKFENTGTIAHSTSAFISLPFSIPTGALPTGGIVMYVNNNSESFTSGKNGTQNTLDTEGGARFFPGNFTTTSAGQHLFFSGFYRTS